MMNAFGTIVSLFLTSLNDGKEWFPISVEEVGISLPCTEAEASTFVGE